MSLLTPQSAFNQVQLQSSFSSSSSSDSSLQLLNMSDVIALCDKDVKLTATQIKQIFKGIVNKISQLQLSHLIRSDNLKKSTQLKQQKNKNYKKDKQDQQDQQLKSQSKQFEINIMEKRDSQFQNIPKPIQKKTKSKKKSQKQSKSKPITQNEKEQIISKVEDKKQKLECCKKQLEQRITKIQEQLVKIKEGFNLQAKAQKQFKISQNQINELKNLIQYEEEEAKNIQQECKYMQEQQIMQNFKITNQQGHKTIQYVGTDQYESMIQLNDKAVNNSTSISIKTIKIKQNNLKVGVIGEELVVDQKLVKKTKISQVCSKYSQLLDKIGYKKQNQEKNDTITLQFQGENDKICKIKWLINNQLAEQKIMNINQNIKWTPCLIFFNQYDKVQIQ